MEERLTIRDEFGNTDVIGCETAIFVNSLEFNELNAMTGALNRLAKYEDTELTPSEIMALKHRADVAEEALKLMAQRCSTTCIYGKGEDFADIMKQVGYFKQQAEERLKEVQK